MTTSLLSVDQARERILSQFQPVTTETLPLMACSHRVLAQDILATSDLPPFDNSSMDGFAVRAEDVREASSDSPRSLRVVAACAWSPISLRDRTQRLLYLLVKLLAL